MSTGTFLVLEAAGRKRLTSMGVLVEVDWWDSFRSVPPKVAMVALVSNDMVAVVLVVMFLPCVPGW